MLRLNAPYAPFIAIALLAMLGGIFAANYYQSEQRQQGSDELPKLKGYLSPARIVYPFQVIDEQGVLFTLDDIKDKWQLMFFGYTNCPDICPTTLQVLQQVKQQLQQIAPDYWSNSQVIFVSIDGQRDTPEHLQQYLSYFDTEFKGLSGSAVQVNSLTKQLGVVSIIGKPDEKGNYTVDHSANIFLISPDNKLVGILGAPHEAEQIAKRYLQMRDRYEGKSS